jgi:hypothetical protein
MQESFTYHIKLQDTVDEEAFNASSPFYVKVAQTDEETTTFILHTDQSGLIGLIRHIHYQGFVILALARK